jgi:putative transposase
MTSHIKNIELSDREKEKLETVVRKPTSPQGLVMRCMIVLMTAEERSVEEIEKQLSTTRATIRKRKDRYMADGFEGLFDNFRSGRKRRKYDTHTRLKIVKFAKRVIDAPQEEENIPDPPEGYRNWTVRGIAEYLGLNRGIVQRVLKDMSIRLHHKAS